MNTILLNPVVFNGAKIIVLNINLISINYFGITLCFLINSINSIPIIHGITKIQVIEKILSKI